MARQHRQPSVGGSATRPAVAAGPANPLGRLARARAAVAQLLVTFGADLLLLAAVGCIWIGIYRYSVTLAWLFVGAVLLLIAWVAASAGRRDEDNDE